jgi:two-component system, NarL family, nitrate/nitrite response regulator NarL
MIGLAMHILLVGSSRLFLEGVARIVGDLGDLGDAVVVRCVDGAEFSPFEALPDLVVLDADVGMGDPAHKTVLGIRSEMPSIPIVVLCTSLGQDVLAELALAGVSACIEKSASAQTLNGALRRVLAGHTHLPLPCAVLALACQDRRREALRQAHADVVEQGFTLTPRQTQILALVARGESNKVIARQLDIAEATVKIHLTAIYKTLRVSNRGKAANIARRLPQIHDEALLA